MSANKHGPNPDLVDPDDAPELNERFLDDVGIRNGGELVRAAIDTLARRGTPTSDAASAFAPRA